MFDEYSANDLFGSACAQESQPGELLAVTSRLFEQRTLLPESDAVIAKALATDAVARRILAKGEVLVQGQLVGVRLNLNIMKTGVAVHTVHKASSKDGHTKGRGFYRGEVISYQPVVVLRDAWFNVHQKSREEIAAGSAAKLPMASIDGALQTVEKVSFDGIEVSFNPKRVHLFVDAENFAVQYAEHATVLGHRAYVRGLVRYFTQSNAPRQEGNSPSDVKFLVA